MAESVPRAGRSVCGIGKDSRSELPIGDDCRRGEQAAQAVSTERPVNAWLSDVTRELSALAAPASPAVSITTAATPRESGWGHKHAQFNFPRSDVCGTHHRTIGPCVERDRFAGRTRNARG